MGNRAVITTKEKSIGVYLHWNGGRDSVQAFLLYCKLCGFRTPSSDCYGWARLVQVIANYFGSNGLSIGIDKVEYLDCNNYDNGVYIIDGWEIVAREFFDGREQQQYELWEMLEDIDKSQPWNYGIEELQKRYCKCFFEEWEFTEHEKQSISDIMKNNQDRTKEEMLLEDFKNTDLELTYDNLYKVFSVNWLLPF